VYWRGRRHRSRGGAGLHRCQDLMGLQISTRPIGNSVSSIRFLCLLDDLLLHVASLLILGTTRFEHWHEQHWKVVGIGVRMLLLCASDAGTEVVFHLAAWPSPSPEFRKWTEM
jgi:hypothetical protein